MENEIIIYQPDETIKLDVRLENETVWLSIDQMANLFKRNNSVVGKHIRNIFKERELIKESVWAKFAYTASDGKIYQVDYYNLDVIISVGYRVKSLRGTQFRRWATKIIKDHLLKGYSLNKQFERIEDKLSKHDAEINKLQQSVDFFVKTSLPPRQGVFYEGQVFDADVFVTKYILSAKKSIILIDNYVDITTLEMLAKKGKNVQIKIITSKKGNGLAPSDVQRFQEQYGRLEISESSSFHDRFIVIDDKELYLSGASLKDLGKKCFAFTKLDSQEIPKLKERT
jgi:hypothetical protein